jgi:phospholipid-binding lipoprotein MlaA
MAACVQLQTAASPAKYALADCRLPTRTVNKFTKIREHSMTSRLLLALLAFATIALSGCAATSPKADPFETVNRATYKFNDVVDKAVLTPVAKGYQAVIPEFARTGISNVFANIGDVATAANNLLQGKPEDAANDVGRVLLNSTIGIFGLIDVATPGGLEKHREDFGQTLGKWGLGSGPYLVLPLLGPSTLRDAPARYVDSYAGYSRQMDHIPTRNTVMAVEIIDLRANLLGASSTLDTAALDKYQFLRDAYLQRRLSQVYDGKVPQAMKDKLEDDLEPPAKPDAKK